MSLTQGSVRCAGELRLQRRPSAVRQLYVAAAAECRQHRWRRRPVRSLESGRGRRAARPGEAPRRRAGDVRRRVRAGAMMAFPRPTDGQVADRRCLSPSCSPVPRSTSPARCARPDAMPSAPTRTPRPSRDQETINDADARGPRTPDAVDRRPARRQLLVRRPPVRVRSPAAVSSRKPLPTRWTRSARNSAATVSSSASSCRITAGSGTRRGRAAASEMKRRLTSSAGRPARSGTPCSVRPRCAEVAAGLGRGGGFARFRCRPSAAAPARRDRRSSR